MPRTTLYGTFVLDFEEKHEPIVVDLSYRNRNRDRLIQLTHGRVKGKIKSWIQKAIDFTDKIE